MDADTEISTAANSDDFYERLAGGVVRDLRRMYGDSLHRRDVTKVVEYLEGLRSLLPETNPEENIQESTK